MELDSIYLRSPNNKEGQYQRHNKTELPIFVYNLIKLDNTKELTRTTALYYTYNLIQTLIRFSFTYLPYHNKELTLQIGIEMYR